MTFGNADIRQQTFTNDNKHLQATVNDYKRLTTDLCRFFYKSLIRGAPPPDHAFDFSWNSTSSQRPILFCNCYCFSSVTAFPKASAIITSAPTVPITTRSCNCHFICHCHCICHCFCNCICNCHCICTCHCHCNYNSTLPLPQLHHFHILNLLPVDNKPQHRPHLMEAAFPGRARI